MAITRQDFKQVPSSGVIPDDRVPASAFAVGYTFTYTGYPSLSTFNHTFTGTIVLHVLDSGDNVKYVITIEETYNLFIFPLAPGLVLYTWNWAPNQESIVGRIGEGEDAPLMTTLGQGSFGVEPAEGSGTTDGEVIINSTFYSGIFTEPLAIGDKIKIKFHNLSAGFVVSRASLTLATELGGGVLRSLFHANTGQTFLLYAADNELKVARTRRMQSGLFLREDILNPSQTPQTICDYEATVQDVAPRYAGLHRYQGVLYADVQTSGFVNLQRSLDDGEHWETAGTIMAADLNMNVLASALSSDAGTLYLYGTAAEAETALGLAKGDAMFAELKNKGNAWKLGARGKIAGEDLPVRDIAGMEYFNGVLRLTGKDDDNSVRLLNSTDGLRNLEPLAIS